MVGVALWQKQASAVGGSTRWSPCPRRQDTGDIHAGCVRRNRNDGGVLRIGEHRRANSTETRTPVREEAETAGKAAGPADLPRFVERPKNSSGSSWRRRYSASAVSGASDAGAVVANDSRPHQCHGPPRGPVRAPRRAGSRRPGGAWCGPIEGAPPSQGRFPSNYGGSGF